MACALYRYERGYYADRPVWIFVRIVKGPDRGDESRPIDIAMFNPFPSKKKSPE